MSETLNEVSFFVPGTPIPQGSKNVSRWGNVYDANHKELKFWRERIATYALAATDKTFTGPVAVDVEFLLQRPKTVKRALPAVKPDLDKIIRGVFDALHCSGTKLLQDDSLICSTTSSKRYCVPPEEPGAFITVRLL